MTSNETKKFTTLTKKCSPMLLSTALNQFLTNVYSSPTQTIMEAYISDFENAVDDYIKNALDPFPDYNVYYALTNYQTAIKSSEKNMHMHYSDDDTLKKTKSENFDFYCQSVRYNNRDPDVRNMLQTIFGLN